MARSVILNWQTAVHYGSARRLEVPLLSHFNVLFLHLGHSFLTRGPVEKTFEFQGSHTSLVCMFRGPLRPFQYFGVSPDKKG